MLAEIKARAISIASREVIERATPPIELEFKEDASLEAARTLDFEHGDFKGAADQNFSVLTFSQDPEQRAQALIGLSQELINLGSFRQARHWLLREDISAFGLSHQRSLFFRARIYEKLGWIADYEMDFFEEEKLMEAAGDILLQSKPQETREDAEREVFSTTRHFLGRAKYSLAATGVNKTKNVNSATEHFMEAMRQDRELSNPLMEAKLGFGSGWIARCYMLVGNFERADEYLSRAELFFDAQLRKTPGRRDFLAHLYCLRGERALRVFDSTEAQIDFLKALNIRMEQVSPYPKGLADAYLGLGLAFKQDGDFIKTARCFKKAVEAHPYSFFRGIIGA